MPAQEGLQSSIECDVDSEDVGETLDMEHDHDDKKEDCEVKALVNYILYGNRYTNE